MGKYRPFEVGQYRLGSLGRDACAVWKEEGRRRRRFRLGTALTQQEAETALHAFAKARNRMVEHGTLTCQDIFERYIEDRRQDGKKTRHQEAAWKQLRGTFSGMLPLDIGKDTCRAYEQKRLADGRKPGTIWTELTDLRAILMWGWKHKPKLIAEPPTIHIRQKPDPKNLFVTRDQFAELLDKCATPHVKLFMILAITTAGRSGAILDLTWSRINFEIATIDLYDPLQERNSKGRALVPMNKTARAALWDAKQSSLSDYVIEWNSRKVGSIKKAFETAAERAGMPWCTPHVLRHTAARWMAEAGVPMSQIAQYLGHKNTSTTERIYARYSPAFLQGAAQAVEIGQLRRIG